MGGCRCSYKSCVRATKNSEKDFHFFHYPVRDPERCLKWINNAKKPYFQDLPEDQLRNKVVCQLHFEQQYFTNAFRKRLVHNAVPSLDAGSEETIPKTEEISVHVLQSDSEGNVFTVDTENLLKAEVRDVTSYVIQNGNLVPADIPTSNEIGKPLIYKISGDDRIVEIENNMDGNNGPECITTEVNIHTEKGNKNSFFTDREHWSESNESVAPIYELHDRLLLEEQTVVADIIPVENNLTKTSKSKPVIKDKTSPSPITNTLEVTNLSRTIQQHSKEIACLKRILRTKINKGRYKKRQTNAQIINNLRGLLPATLHAAVSLHLLKRDNNFSKNERNFLTVLYKASPAAYEVLLKDCKWKLPDSDTVKKLISNRNCVR